MISGSEISLPFILKTPDKSPAMTTTVTVRLKDADGNLLDEVKKTVNWEEMVLSKPAITLSKNAQGVEGTDQIAGQMSETGNVVTRSKRAYTVSLGQETIDYYEKLVAANATNNGKSSLSPKIKIEYDKDNFLVVNSGDANITRYTGIASDPDNDGVIYVDVNEYLQRIVTGNFGLYAVYKGTDLNVPDSDFKISLVQQVNGQDVTLFAGDDYSHTNTWRVLDDDDILRGTLLIPTLETIIDTSFVKYTPTGFAYASNVNQGYYETKTTTKEAEKNNRLTTDPEISLTGNNATAKPTVSTITTLASPSATEDAYLDVFEVDVATQIDGTTGLADTGFIGIRYTDNFTLLDTANAEVYYIDTAGVRHVLGKLGDVVASNTQSTANIYVENAVKVGIDFGGNGRVSNQGLQIITILTNNDDTDFSEYRTNYSVSDNNTRVTDIESNTFRYSARIKARDGLTGAEGTFLWYSNLAAFTKLSKTSQPRIYSYNAANPLLVGQKTDILGQEIFHVGGGNWLVGDNAYAYLALPTALKITSWTTGGNPTSSEQIDVNGVSYTIYKFPVTSLTYNDSEAHRAVGLTTQAMANGATSDQITWNAYYGLVFDGEVARESGYYYSGGNDVLDLNGDGSLITTGNEDRVVIGTQASYKLVVSKSLFIYDNSSYKGSTPTADTKGVIAGDVVTITPTVNNNTDGTTYTDISVITVLSNTQDEVFDGSSSRGSEFTPTLTGPVTPPTGWTVYYTTDAQDPNESGDNLTGWATSVDDYSKVTALKWVSNSGTKIAPGDSVKFAYDLQTPADAQFGQTITTTSAIAVNGVQSYLEGYRSTVQIKKSGTVTVEYVDEDGKLIDFSNGSGVTNGTATDTAPAYVGTAYDTQEFKYPTITDAKGYLYELVEEKVPANATGTVVEGETKVTYVYKMKTESTDTPLTKTGSVNVVYVNEAGEPLFFTNADNVTINGSHAAVTNEVVSNGTLTTVTSNGQVVSISENVTPTNYVYDVDTTVLKPTTITTTDGKTYTFSKVDDNSAPVTDTLAEGTTTVTYVYKEVTGSVIVKYEDEAGTEIKPEVKVVDNASTGTSYDTNDKRETTIKTDTGKTYTYKEVKSGSANETGTVTTDTQTVTYVYKEVTGSVIVKYEDEAGTEIKPEVKVVDNASTGTAYNTANQRDATITTANGKTYTYKEVKSGSANETGTVTTDTQTVTYVYTEVKGSVIVKYEDEAGNEIKAEVKVVDNGSTGTAYNTTDKRESTITTANGKTYTYKEVKPDSASETGTVTTDPQTVTYVYTEVKGSVIVKYEDEAGNEIKAEVKAVDNGSTGTAYNTTDKRESTITTANGKTYTYKEVKPGSAGETGTVTTDPQTVTYVYTEVKGSVIVKYEDEAGNEIKAEVKAVDNGSTGTAYNTTDKRESTITTANGKTYTYKEVKPDSASETGTVTTETQTVTYVYTEVKGSVIVKYEDEAGTEIKPEVKVVDNGSTGTAYNTADQRDATITTDDGKTYTYKEIKSGSAGEIGTVTTDTQTVTYVYTEVKGSVIVKYEDEAGNEIKTEIKVVDNGSTGTAYNTTDKREVTITTDNGKTYTYKEVKPDSASETGAVTTDTQTVTYVYTEVKGSVIVKYEDESGNEIKTEVKVVDNGSTGTTYNTADKREATIKTDDGKTYTYKEVKPGSAGETGAVTTDTQTVTYVYTEVKGSVIVKYEDESGTEIKTVVKVVDNASTGTSYDTADHREATITTDDGKTYTYKEVKPESANETGIVTTETQTVTYVYTEVKGKVVVHYVDTEGNTLQADVEDTPETSTGTAYDTTDYKPTTITKNGNTYKLVETSTQGNEQGTVQAGTTDITYVYEVVKKGQVIVDYKDESGNPLQPSVTDTPSSDEGTPYDTTDHKPTTITTPDGKTYELVPEKTQGTEQGTVSAGDTTVTYVYKEVAPTIQVVTHHVDENGKPVANDEEGKADPKTTSELSGYEHVSTTTDKDGNTTHVYKPVTPTPQIVTHHLDENGKPLANDEEGKTAPKTSTALPGYEHVSTITDKDGNTTHVYKPVTPVTQIVTHHVDENGKPLANDEEGKTAPKTSTDLPGYEHVSTTTDKDGNTTHVYKPITPVIQIFTHHVDETGKPLANDEAGKTAPKTSTALPGYEHVSTTTDKDGNTIHVYKPVTPPAQPVVTHHVDENGNPLANDEEGKTAPKTGTDLPGYEHVSTTTDKEGNTTHVYKPVTPTPQIVTHHVDEQGNPLANSEEGKTSPKTSTDLPGYEHVSTTTDKDGNTIHVYKPITPVIQIFTHHVDETGNPLANVEEGKTSPKTSTDLPGYEHVSTTTDKDGNTTHVYKPVTPVIQIVTHHVDENGNPLANVEEGKTAPKTTSDLPGYEHVSTTTDKDGNTTHVYKPITPVIQIFTHHVDETGNPLANVEEGKTSPKTSTELSGYEHVSTTTDKDGNTTHVYKPVTSPAQPVVTHHVDENGKPLANDEAGKTSPKTSTELSGYEHVSTTTDNAGNTTHVYKPVTPSSTTQSGTSSVTTSTSGSTSQSGTSSVTTSTSNSTSQFSSSSVTTSTSNSTSQSGTSSVTTSTSSSTSQSGSSSVTTSTSSSTSQSSLSSVTTSTSSSTSQSGSSSVTTSTSSSTSQSGTSSVTTSTSSSTSQSGSPSVTTSTSSSTSQSGSPSVTTSTSNSTSQFSSSSVTTSTSNSTSQFSSSSVMSSASSSTSQSISSSSSSSRSISTSQNVKGSSGGTKPISAPVALSKSTGTVAGNTASANQPSSQNQILPKTGQENSYLSEVTGLGLLTLMAVVRKKRKKD